jgi:hypothetical protein
MFLSIDGERVADTRPSNVRQRPRVSRTRTVPRRDIVLVGPVV